MSNDVVIVAFAPVVLTRPHTFVDTAAMYVGANITGGLLPQGSPKSLLALGDISFSEYLSHSAPASAAMFAAAVAVIAAARFDAPPRAYERAVPVAMSAAQRRVACGAVAVAVAQPVAELAGIGRLWVAVGVAGAAVRAPWRAVAGGVPWSVAPIVAALTVTAPVVADAADVGGGGGGWFAAMYGRGAADTDIAAAAFAAASPDMVAAHPAATLASITAAAFATPLASISGILLLGEHRAARRRGACRNVHDLRGLLGRRGRGGRGDHPVADRLRARPRLALSLSAPESGRTGQHPRCAVQR